MIEWLIALLASAFVGYAPQPPATPRPVPVAPVVTAAPATVTTTVAPVLVGSLEWCIPDTRTGATYPGTSSVGASPCTPTAADWDAFNAQPTTVPTTTEPPIVWVDECIPDDRPGAVHAGTTRVGAMPCTP